MLLRQWKLLPFIVIVVLVKAESTQNRACIFPLGFCLSKHFHISYEESIIYIERITYKWSGEVAWYLKKGVFCNQGHWYCASEKMFFCIASLSSTNRHQLIWQIAEPDVVKLTHGVNNILYKSLNDIIPRNEWTDKCLSQNPRNRTLEFLMFLYKSLKWVLTEATDFLMCSVMQEWTFTCPCLATRWSFYIWKAAASHQSRRTSAVVGFRAASTKLIEQKLAHAVCYTDHLTHESAV